MVLLFGRKLLLALVLSGEREQQVQPDRGEAGEVLGLLQTGLAVAVVHPPVVADVQDGGPLLGVHCEHAPYQAGGGWNKESGRVREQILAEKTAIYCMHGKCIAEICSMI